MMCFHNFCIVDRGFELIPQSICVFVAQQAAAISIWMYLHFEIAAAIYPNRAPQTDVLSRLRLYPPDKF